jgi:hypothetical protein
VEEDPEAETAKIALRPEMEEGGGGQAHAAILLQPSAFAGFSLAVVPTFRQAGGEAGGSIRLTATAFASRKRVARTRRPA